MRLSHRLRAGLIALIAVRSARALRAAAYADSGTIWITEFKGGWVFGASVGRGTLSFHGKRYPLSVGGLSWGFVFGGSRTTLVGHRDQHQPAIGRRRGLWRRRCGRRGRGAEHARSC